MSIIIFPIGIVVLFLNYFNYKKEGEWKGILESEYV